MLFLMPVMMTALMSAPAEAGEVEIWRGEFPNDVYLDGEAGWSSGYDGDTWYGYQGNDGTFYGLPLSDDYEENGCERWSGACSNWLTNSAEDVTDGRFTVSIYSEDDDTLGIAFGQQSEDDYLLFVLCGDGDAS